MHNQCLKERMHGIVSIENSKVLQNYAYKGSSLFLYSHVLESATGVSGSYIDDTSVNLVNCNFELNVGLVQQYMLLS